MCGVLRSHHEAEIQQEQLELTQETKAEIQLQYSGNQGKVALRRFVGSQAHPRNKTQGHKIDMKPLNEQIRILVSFYD